MPGANGSLSTQDAALRRRNYRAVLPSILPRILPADWAWLLKKSEAERSRQLDGIVDLLMQLEEKCPSEDQAKVIAAMKTTSFSHREQGKLLHDLETLSMEVSTQIGVAQPPPRRLKYWSGHLWAKVMKAMGGDAEEVDAAVSAIGVRG